MFFYVWEDTSLWAHWINSFHSLSYLGPNPVSLITLRSGRWLLLVCPLPTQLISSLGVGWWHLMDCRYCVQSGETSFTFGGQKLLFAVTFLFYWYGKRCFISQPFPILINLTIFGRHFMTFCLFVFVPLCWEAHPRLSKGPHWYVMPGVNFQIRLINK